MVNGQGHHMTQCGPLCSIGAIPSVKLTMYVHVLAKQNYLRIARYFEKIQDLKDKVET